MNAILLFGVLACVAFGAQARSLLQDSEAGTAVVGVGDSTPVNAAKGLLHKR